MVKIFKINKILMFICLIIIVISTPISYVYWMEIDSTENLHEEEVGIGYFLMLDENIPMYIRKQLLEIFKNNKNDKDSVYILIESVKDIIKLMTAYEHEENKIVIGFNADDLFNRNLPLKQDSLLIYLVENDDKIKEPQIIHIGSNNFTVTDSNSLEYALELPWTNINQISNSFLEGNLYEVRNTLVNYDGKNYLRYFEGTSGTIPTLDKSSWFEVSEDYTFIESNSHYLTNHIVRYQEQFYIAKSDVLGGNPISNSWGWNLIDKYTEDKIYQSDMIVYTIDEDNVYHFWKSRINSNKTLPNEDTAKMGQWLEFNNAWITSQTNRIIQSHYFTHNQYKTGEVIAYGTSYNNLFRYFKAIKDVNFGIPPLKETNGFLELNDEYWEVF